MAQPLPSEIASLLTRIEGLKRASSVVPVTITTLSTGLNQLDQVLGGGLPIGRLTEAVIPRGHSASFLLALAIAGADAGCMIAWVDPRAALDLRGAEAAGLDLSHVLWVRSDQFDSTMRAVDLLLASDAYRLVLVDLAEMHVVPTWASPQPARQRSGFLKMDVSLWNRLAKRAEISGSALVVCTPGVRAGGAAALGLEVQVTRCEWAGGERSPLTLEGAALEVTVLHQKRGGQGQKVVVSCQA